MVITLIRSIMNSLTINGIRHTSDELKKLALQYENSHQEYIREFWKFVGEWYNDSSYVEVSTSGSTGTPKKIKVLKKLMVNSALMTCGYLKLEPGDNALLCLSTGYIAGKMMVVRAIVADLNLTVVEPSGTPFIDKPYAFCAMVPMQVFNILSSPEQQFSINQIGKLIIGGGAVSSSLRGMIEHLTVECFATYGMTETVSHIALRKLNGADKQSSYYPLSEVKVSLDERSCLVIDAPLVTTSILTTNDIAEILDDGSFRILGRIDNIINSGGIKIIPEVVEAKLSGCTNRSFAISSVPDDRFGEKIVLVVEGENQSIFNFNDVLQPYERPKLIIVVNAIPTTANGKINRIALRELLLRSIKS